MPGNHAQNRKMTFSIQTLQSDHSPLKSEVLTLAQTRHKFLFGTAAFDTLPLANHEWEGSELENGLVRTEKMLALCNAATLPFYWSRYEPVRGQPTTNKMLNAARWCKENNLVMKGHPLCWHTLTADWLREMAPRDVLTEQIRRIQRDVIDFQGLVDMWDVINEPVIMPVFTKYENGITRLCRQMGRINLIRTLFETTRAANPSAILLINDFDTSTAYDILIEGCLMAGIQFDAIGIQSHMHQGWWGVEKTMEILDRFGRFGIPLHFTETTLVSGNLMPPEIVDLNDYQVSHWPSTPDGEERQAREVITHYKTLFNHPLVESITWWDLTDGYWLNAPSGLLRKDGTSKPAYDELLKLVKGEWWLAPTEVRTDDSGVIHYSGYPGEYEISYRDRQYRFEVGSGVAGNEITIQLG